jgi:hypothetical protein
VKVLFTIISTGVNKSAHMLECLCESFLQIDREKVILFYFFENGTYKYTRNGNPKLSFVTRKSESRNGYYRKCGVFVVSILTAIGCWFGNGSNSHFGVCVRIYFGLLHIDRQQLLHV